MLFFGHIAISVALADATDSDPNAAVAGNLLPDLMDKTGSWVIKAMPSARWLAHGLPFFLLAGLAARLLLPERSWKGFMLGYASHLVADLYAGGRVPWFAPFEAHARKRGKFSFKSLAINLIPEALGLAFLSWRDSNRSRNGDG
jgi:hypothetical protein